MPPDKGLFVLLLVKEVKGISMFDAHWDCHTQKKKYELVIEEILGLTEKKRELVIEENDQGRKRGEM